jgi:subtilisin family serine protease
MQYQGILQRKENGSTIPFAHLYKQIPQLRDRVIVVGNLFPDGVTIASNSSLPGAIYKDFIFAPPFAHLYKQIPQLRDRVIVVGNLFPDGVTIASNSSLPGAIYKDFIFAPSEGVATLYPEIIGKNLAGRSIYSEVGSFGGTSGASPRVAGVLVLLGRLFPSLSMTTIRRCVLETADPFWEDPKNNYLWIKNYATTTYGKRIFGQGRINAANAYSLCREKQEEMDKYKIRSDLNIQ